MKKKMLFVIATIVAFVLFVPSALAAEKTVTTQAELIEALNDNTVTKIKLGADINLTTLDETPKGTRSVGAVIERSVIIDGTNTTGDNYKITNSTIRTSIEVYAGAEVINVTLSNLALENTYAGGRAIDTRTGNINLTLSGVNIVTTLTKDNDNHDEPLAIGGTSKDQNDVVVTIEDSELSAGEAGYGIMVYNPVELTINNSTVSGYTALYFKAADSSVGSAGSVVTVKNGSELVSYNKYSGESNNFGTIAFEDDNIEVNIIDSTVEANSTGESLNAAFSVHPDTTIEVGNKVDVSGESTLTVNVVEGSEEEFVRNSVEVIVHAGVTSNVDSIDDYLADDLKVEEDEDGNFVVVPDTVVLTLTGVYDGETISEATAQVKDIIRNSVFSEEDIEDLDALVESINDELKADGLLLKGLYTDKEGTKQVDLTKTIADDTTWYMIFADAVETWDGEYIFAEDAVAIYTYIIENGKNFEDGEGVVYFKKGSVLPEELLEELELLEEEVNKEYKDKGLVFLGVFYDKEGKNKVDFTKALEEDIEWYLIIGEKVEELPPKTGDVNLVILIGTILVGAAGAVIISKKRFAKSN